MYQAAAPSNLDSLAPSRPDGMSPCSEASRRDRRTVLAVCGFLVLAVALVFGQTVRFDFVNFDDSVCVYDNYHVSKGLTKQDIAWAFTQSEAGAWQPLVWLSLMADREVFGLLPGWLHCTRPGWFHFTNVLLHAIAAVLLFLVLRQMTGRLWPAAFVAAVFAVHPLRAESVAWITERRDVLSGVFFMLLLGAYAAYARRAFSLLRYAAVVMLLALGLMAKPVLVTAPCLLLLLDYWPLRRMFLGGVSAAAAPRDVLKNLAWLVLEKIPLFVLAGASCVATVWAQGDALISPAQSPWSWRIGNALISYVGYLGNFFYPVHLAVAYPRRDMPLPLWQVLGAAVLLASLTAAAVAAGRKYPYGIVGWFWYLGMMLPVIGLIQFGVQAEADRFTYLPQIGICLTLAWGAADVSRRWPQQRILCGLGSAAVLIALAACACRQTSYWRDSETLWTRALDCNRTNAVAHANLGVALADLGRPDEAVAEYRNALKLNRNDDKVHGNLGLALVGMGRIDEAFAEYRTALKINPRNAGTQNNLGVLLADCGRLDEASAHYQTALSVKPDHVDAHSNLGIVLAGRGRVAEAIAHYRKALEINPDYAKAHNNLGNALAGLGRIDEASAEFRKALEINPDYAEAHAGLGNVLAGRGHLDEAILHYRKALEIKPDYAEAHSALGKALADRGQVDEALTHYRRALAIKPDYAEAHFNLASDLAGRGEVAEAAAECRKALVIKPDLAEAHAKLGILLAGCGEVNAAIAQCRKALEIKPDFAEAHGDLGAILAGRGQVDEAILHYRKALAIKPDFAEAHVNLAAMLAGRGEVDEAVAHLQKALAITPDFAEAHSILGALLAGRGEVDEAVAHCRNALKIMPGNAAMSQNLAVALSARESILKALDRRRKALRLRPTDVALLNDTAWMLATNPNASVRNGAEAVELAQRASRLSGGSEPDILATLAAAYAEAGRFPDAVRTAEDAIRAAVAAGNRTLAEQLRSRVKLYRNGTPSRQPPG
jgi:tetratricopeptide (TPR) repeat protein